MTIGVAFILFTLATAGVKGFAFTLGIGTLVSLFTAVLATSAILGSMARTRLLRSPSALGAGRERVSWQRFDFMGKSNWFFSMSGVILAVGALAIVRARHQLRHRLRVRHAHHDAARADARASTRCAASLEPLGYGDAKIQNVNDPELGKNVFQISGPTLKPEKVEPGRARARRQASASAATTSRRARSGRRSARRSRARR